ncbi:MAG: HAMP domain-containing sensor histidine kinase [Lachnospiraceae bacterium]|nr:HAMP domain-containing sensor histidine kinase [Lachnospiraceae bacterium]
MKREKSHFYRSGKVARTFQYGFFMTVGIALLVVALNLVFFIISVVVFAKRDVSSLGGGEVREALAVVEDVGSATEEKYVLTDEMAQRLAENKQWAMLLDAEGRELWSYRKPAELADTYSRVDIARMTRWYLDGYPVWLRIWDDEIMVVGMEKDTVWKYPVEFSISWMEYLKQVGFYYFLINIAWIVLLAAFFTRRFMRNREQARIEWIAGISHDIRTPLSMVMGYADTLEQNGELSEEARQQAAVILHQSMVMKELIADLNLTSQLEYSMQPLRMEKIRPAQALRSVAAAFLNDDADGNLEIEVEIDAQAEQIMLRADEPLLQRAFRNLILNSIKHGGQSEVVEIRIKMQEERRRFIKLFRNCDRFVICFEDNGAGFSEEILRRLRDNKKNDANPKIRGLEIVKKIVLAHGGKVRFGNREEGGSFCEMRFFRS